MAAGDFNIRAWGPEYLSGDGWEMEWLGQERVAQMLEASRLAIDELNAEAVAIALEHPFWDNRSGQTEEAVFYQRAEWDESRQQMWGIWGVVDRPRVDDDDGQVWWYGGNSEGAVSATGNSGWSAEFNYGPDRILTTKDVALFLEFGTIKMDARPWLYPAFNATKVRLPARVAEIYRALGGNAKFRDPAGRFATVPDLHL